MFDGNDEDRPCDFCKVCSCPVSRGHIVCGECTRRDDERMEEEARWMSDEWD